MSSCSCTGACRAPGGVCPANRYDWNYGYPYDTTVPHEEPWVSPNTVETPPIKVGWKCPVCGLGNAPFAVKCGHCVAVTTPFISDMT